MPSGSARCTILITARTPGISGTLAIQEWDTPMKEPHRPRFHSKGVLWIPAFDDSGLMHFDTATQSFAIFEISPIGAGEYEPPYALNADRRTGEIWMSANNSNRILRFFSAGSQFMSYPSPPGHLPARFRLRARRQRLFQFLQSTFLRY
jgi:streptogramin lyase